MAILRYRPLTPTFSSIFDRMFDEDVAQRETGFSVPDVNVREDDDNYFIDLAAPGMKKEDFNVTLDNNVLTITSEKKEEQKDEEEKYSRREYNYQSFSRSFTLPETIKEDIIEAKYEDGILKLTLPKKEEAKQKPSKTIDIT